MTKQKMKQREEKKEVVRIVYFLYCPNCNQEIKGTKASQVDYNLRLHLEKCEKEKK